MNEDASVVIKIKGNKKDFESKIEELNKKYKNKEIDMKITANELGQAEKSLELMNKQVDSLDNKYNELNQKIKEQQEIVARASTYNPETKSYSIHDYSAYNKAINSIDILKIKQRNVADEMDKQNELLDKQESKVNKLNALYEKQKNDLEDIKNKMNEASKIDMGEKSSGKLLKNITRWGLAIFGVRSAYMGIRTITNSVLSQNEGLSNQMEAMKNSFTNAFTPIVEKIVNLFKTLMAYANVIWRAFFGKDLFKNIAKSTEKTSKNLGSSAKSAKEINKQLAGFDEANVLSNNQSSSSGAGVGASAGGGKIDLGLDKVKIPGWLEKLQQWIKDNPKLAKIVFGLAPFAIFGMASLVKKGVTSGIAKLLGKAGAGKLASGASGLLGVLGTCALLAGTVVAVYFAAKGIDELLTAYADLHASQGRVEDAMKQENVVLDRQTREFIDNAEAGKTSNKEMNTMTSHLRNVIKETKAQIDSNVLNKGAQKAANEEIQKAAVAYKELYDKGLLTEEQEYEYYKFLVNDYVPGLDLSTDHGRAMADVMNEMAGTYNIRFREEGLASIRDSIQKTGDKISGLINNPQFKKWIGGNANITAAYDYLKKQGVIKYANGGIVNMPGRGVPLSIAGEAGREGIVPMDNESQMQLLGQSIAKYVRIDNYVNNYMDARKINTLLQQSASRERLANNG